MQEILAIFSEVLQELLQYDYRDLPRSNNTIAARISTLITRDNYSNNPRRKLPTHACKMRMVGFDPSPLMRNLPTLLLRDDVHISHFFHSIILYCFY